MRTSPNTSTEHLTPMVEYGRIELKQSFQRNYTMGLAISTIFHFSIIGGYYLVQLGEGEEIPMVRVKILKYSDLGPPPSITNAPLPPALSVMAAAKPTIGFPVPVPDAEVSAEQTMATQAEMSALPSPAMEDFGENGVEITGDLMVEDEPGMDEFIPVERPPQIVKRVMPIYPEMAVRAGLEGTVWVKVLVDKDGKPKKVVVVKSTTDILEQAAVDAATQFIFTPAIMNQGPIKVWVSIPFRFQLKDVKSPS